MRGDDSQPDSMFSSVSPEQRDGMNTATSTTTQSLLQILLFVGVWLLFEYVLVRQLAIAWIPLFAGGFLLWWFAIRKTPFEPQKIMVPYLLTTIMFIVHVYEEYKAHLLGFPDITPVPVSFEELVTFAATLGPIIWLLGAVMMLKRVPVGSFVAGTFLFGMMFIEPAHLIAPFWRGSFHYVGGLWTAPLLSGLGWYTFLAIRREIGRGHSALER
jgi:hypothetical protein